MSLYMKDVFLKKRLKLSTLHLTGEKPLPGLFLFTPEVYTISTSYQHDIYTLNE